MPLTHEHVGSKIVAKSKSISSPEQNYFSIFAMRYPVRKMTQQERWFLLTCHNLKLGDISCVCRRANSWSRVLVICSKYLVWVWNDACRASLLVVNASKKYTRFKVQPKDEQKICIHSTINISKATRQKTTNDDHCVFNLYHVIWLNVQ